jgi:hypothetical protein
MTTSNTGTYVYGNLRFPYTLLFSSDPPLYPPPCLYIIILINGVYNCVFINKNTFFYNSLISYKHIVYVYMFQFACLYIWNLVIMSFGCLIVKPFTGYQYSDYICNYICYEYLRIKHNYIKDAELIDNGFILANHRCALDMFIDTPLVKASVVGRGMVYIANAFYGILFLIEGRGIILYRGTDTRETTYAKCKRKGGRIIFYPEGTRNSYTSLRDVAELKTYLKYGLLKSIYEDGIYPVQIQISNNKELALNEKKFTIGYNLEMNTRLSKPIHPADFATSQEFFDEIARVWYDCYVSTHTK